MKFSDIAKCEILNHDGSRTQMFQSNKHVRDDIHNNVQRFAIAFSYQQQLAADNLTRHSWLAN